jgi:toxin ParE1/3/4
MKVIITENAMDDLLSIGRSIEKDNPQRALSFLEELETKCMRLGETPRAYPLLPEWKHTGIRRRVHGNYLIFYRVNATAVEVLHILHGARDYKAILFPDEG